MARPNLKKEAALKQIEEMKANGLEMPEIRKKLEDTGILNKAQLDDLFGVEKKTEPEPEPKKDEKTLRLKETLMDMAHGLEYEWKRLKTVDRPDEKTARQQIEAIRRKLVGVANAL